MIARGGHLVYPWGNQDTIYDLKSSTKSIGGSALGPALVDNFLQLTDCAQQYLPSLGLPPDSNAATGWLYDITVAALATHMAGFDRQGGLRGTGFRVGQNVVALRCRRQLAC
jgi:CubicO group peptidase (beta-lactamase class C family)